MPPVQTKGHRRRDFPLLWREQGPTPSPQIAVITVGPEASSGSQAFLTTGEKLWVTIDMAGKPVSHLFYLN